MILDYLGEKSAGDLLYRAVQQNLAEKKVRTADVGGRSKTREVGDDIVHILRSF